MLMLFSANNSNSTITAKKGFSGVKCKIESTVILSRCMIQTPIITSQIQDANTSKIFILFVGWRSDVLSSVQSVFSLLLFKWLSSFQLIWNLCLYDMFGDKLSQIQQSDFLNFSGKGFVIMVGGLRESPFKQIEIAVALILISFFGNGFPQFYQKIIMAVQFKLWESLNHS